MVLEVLVWTFEGKSALQSCAQRPAGLRPLCLIRDFITAGDTCFRRSEGTDFI